MSAANRLYSNSFEAFYHTDANPFYDPFFLHRWSYSHRDKIIIFQDSHWFWGRYRPSNDIYWSGRNEMGELLMLVRDSHRASLAKFMPLEPFPLSSNASSSPSMSAGTRRPMSASLPGAQRPQSIMSMDRIPSGPFSRLATSSSSVESASARSFTVLSGLPDFGTTNLENAPEVLSLRSPRSSISSSGFTPPPPYTSHSGIPNDRPFDSLLLPSHPPAPASSHFIGQSDGLRRDVRRNPRQPVPVTVQQSQTLPNRLRLIPVNEDSEMEALNRLREEYQRDRDQSDRHRLVSDFDDITILRALNARRLNRQEIADVQRKLRNAERERANAEAILSRRGLYQPSYSVGRAIHASSPNIPSMSSAALKKSDELGALRAREIEERIIAHRKAMRYCQDTRREREIERIEGLNGAAMSRRYSMPPLSH